MEKDDQLSLFDELFKATENRNTDENTDRGTDEEDTNQPDAAAPAASDLLPPREDASPRAHTVSEITALVRDVLTTNIGPIRVEGEISNWKRHRSGHCYFTLKDEGAALACVMFRPNAMRLRFEPDNGQKALAEGRIDVYERQGKYQLVVERLSPAGMGDLHRRFLELRERLQAEGLFDPAHKKPLPFLPQTIAVVTSPTGAAVRDILNVLRRRFANLRVLIYPVQVQGDRAAPQVAAAVRRLNAWRAALGLDVIIVARGGGSMEDLWAFNEEEVARAVYESEVPVISGVGHEIDFTICDFAADVRAPTPSAAAELVVQNREELERRVRDLGAALRRAVRHRAEAARAEIERLRHHYGMRHPVVRLRETAQRLDDIDERLRLHQQAILTARKDRLRRARERLTTLGAMRSRDAAQRVRRAEEQLRALGPENVLARGYSIVRRADGSEIIRDAAALAEGERLDLQFHAGAAEAEVKKIRKNPKNNK